MNKTLIEFKLFIKHMWRSRELFFTLVKNDFRSQYLGSYFGLFWAFFQPLSFILLLWFVFEVGFKAKPSGDIPYILWLISGLIPWFFISGTITSSSNSIASNSYLVKKVAFRVSILPLVKIAISLIIHLFFLILLLIISILYGYSPSVYWFQLPIYLFMSLIFLTGFSWLLSSIVIFIKDISQVVPIFIQFSFWVTPIFWNSQNMSQKHKYIVDYNPFNFIIEGYRNSIIYHKYILDEPFLFLYHLTFYIIIFVLGAFIFKRLRPHFADVI